MKKITVAIFCIIMAITTGCTKKPEAKPPIKIAINVWPGYAHAFIAQEKGYFKKNGVNVELILDRDYTTNTKRYTNAEVDGVFEVYAEAILQNSEGIPTIVVYVCDYSITGDVIIGRSEFKDLADLKGKKIGIEGVNTFSNLFVLAALEKAGIKEQEMRFEIIPAHEIIDALKDGRIDAGHTYEPTKSKVLQMGYKILGNAGDVPGIITDVLVFKESTIKNRPQEIKAVVKAILEAREFVYSDKEESLKIMSKQMGMTEAEMENGLQGVKHLDLKENIKAMQKSADNTSLYGSGEIIADFYMKRGQLSRLPDLDKMIETRFVEELGK